MQKIDATTVQSINMMDFPNNLTLSRCVGPTTNITFYFPKFSQPPFWLIVFFFFFFLFCILVRFQFFWICHLKSIKLWQQTQKNLLQSRLWWELGKKKRNEKKKNSFALFGFRRKREENNKINFKRCKIFFALSPIFPSFGSS